MKTQMTDMIKELVVAGEKATQGKVDHRYYNGSLYSGDKIILTKHDGSMDDIEFVEQFYNARPAIKAMQSENERLREYEEDREASDDTMLALHSDQRSEIELLTTENERLAALLAECEGVIEKAQNGLEWYQEEHPEDASGADDELHEEINTLLAKLKAGAK